MNKNGREKIGEKKMVREEEEKNMVEKRWYGEGRRRKTWHEKDDMKRGGGEKLGAKKMV